MKKTISQLMIAIVALASLVIVAAPAAEAAASPYLWNSRGSSVFVSTSGLWGLRGAAVRNGTAFTPYCYADGPWRTGNYSTNRYFYGRAWAGTHFNGWVHASYVQLQTRVGRC